MIKISLYYPKAEGTQFDVEYYHQKHMSFVQERLSSAGLIKTGVERGISGEAPDSEPPFHCVGHLYFETEAAYWAAMGEHGKELVADIPNFTNAKPSFLIAEVVS